MFEPLHRIALARLACIVFIAAAPAAAQRSTISTPLVEDVNDTQAAQKAVADIPGEFNLHQTKHYTILYSGSVDDAMARGDILERGYNAYFTFMRLMRFDLNPPKQKLTVIVFDKPAQFQVYRSNELAKDHDVGNIVLQGYYHPGTNRAAFFNQTNSVAYQLTRKRYEQLADSVAAIEGGPDTKIKLTSADGEQIMTKQQAFDMLRSMAQDLQKQFADENQTVTLHEGAHQLAFNTGLQSRSRSYPFWVSEGMACMFETPATRRAIGPYLVNEERMNTYRNARDANRLFGLEALLTLNDVPSDRLLDAYAESWSLFFFLLKRHPKEFSEYLHELSERKETFSPDDRAAKEIETFKRHFGDDLGAIETKWRRFIDRTMHARE